MTLPAALALLLSSISGILAQLDIAGLWCRVSSDWSHWVLIRTLYDVTVEGKGHAVCAG